jgi:hypothetical protein
MAAFLKCFKTADARIRRILGQRQLAAENPCASLVLRRAMMMRMMR